MILLELKHKRLYWSFDQRPTLTWEHNYKTYIGAMEHIAQDPGFVFERRSVASELSHKRTATKTGTTICGLVFSSGIVLGADTRSTNGETVADKNCEKIHFISPNIYCCGAGTAADTEAVTGELLLWRIFACFLFSIQV